MHEAPNASTASAIRAKQAEARDNIASEVSGSCGFPVAGFVASPVGYVGHLVTWMEIGDSEGNMAWLQP